MKILNTKLGFCHLMIPSRVFKYLVLFFFSINSFAQLKISGVVTDSNNQKLAGVEVYNKTNRDKTYTNTKGEFEFNYKKKGSFDFVFYKEGFGIVEQISITTASSITVVLTKINKLTEVIIQKQNDKLLAIKKLRDIEETAIYAGKKTEVININNITANKSVNNARQIFAQVVGLTINESSDGGLQLSIGSRGLNPNRTANFNTRQNGYDISADVLGYPESYYTTPTEALEEIQIVRGAASLQYGTQFGGLINFKTKTPSFKPIEAITRNTVGSFGLYTNFTSLSGTNNKFSYYTYINYKKGNGFRPNSNFESKNYFANLNYKFNNQTSLHFDYTYYNYLAQQAGGLTDEQFKENPLQSNRTRNWFAVDWNLFALRLKHKFNEDADLSLQLFGLDASRKALGFRDNRITTPDELKERDLIMGDFINWGAEGRFLKKYNLRANKSAFLVGFKYYQAKNSQQQGPGSSGSNANFNLATTEFPLYKNQSNYTFPNLNLAIFSENIFKLNSSFSITPGIRIEKIRTKAVGSYQQINLDGAGNEIFNNKKVENNIIDRNIVLLGVGVSYKPKNTFELYGNLSQNYRSVTFNDIRTVNAGQVIDENIKDEKGFTSDIGVRGELGKNITFDSSIFGLYYDGKIDNYDDVIDRRIVRIRSNIGTAVTYGFETLLQWNIAKTYFESSENLRWNLFTNSAITGSRYLETRVKAVEVGGQVEFVPLLNLKTGTGIGYKNFITSLLFTYVSSQLSSANSNNLNNVTTGISGNIPAYFVADFSTSYKWKRFKLEAGINNFTNNSYFTRRATGYPGPGIIPSDNRSFYTTLEMNF